VNIFGKKRNNKVNFKEIKINLNPFEAFARLSKKFDDIYILESIFGPEKLSEFSYIGFNPSLMITLDNNIIKVVSKNNENNRATSCYSFVCE